MSKQIPPDMMEAVNDYALRLRNAMRTFRASNDPLWKRTKEGLDWFGGLPMTHLPPRLVQDIDTRFAAINAILADHSVDTLQDYRRVPAADLIEIQDIVEGFAFDEGPYQPRQKGPRST